MNPERLRGLAQPDQRSCGPSTLVAARMLIDPAYEPASFSGEVLDLHRRITGPVAFGRVQVPWPRALGTPPWAVARAMIDLTGTPHRTHVVRWGDRTDDLARLAAAAHPCPFYVGDRWLPRHVVLVVGTSAETLQVYNPARGTLVDVPRAELESGELTGFGRWVRAWFVVAPVSPRRRERRTPA